MHCVPVARLASGTGTTAGLKWYNGSWTKGTRGPQVRRGDSIVTAGEPDEQEFATPDDLLVALDYDLEQESSSADDLEDYVLGYLDEDLGMNLFVTLGDDYVDLLARLSFHADEAVHMWSLQFPTTVTKFHRYLDELDLRVARLRAIVDLPGGEDRRDPDGDDPSIPAVLARLFQTTETELVGELGDDWVPIDSEEAGIESQPVRFLAWAGRVVLGLDDEYLHLFRFDGPKTQPDAGAAITSFEFGDGGTMSLTDLSTILRGPTESW